MSKIIPRGPHLVARPVAVPAETASGLIVPETAQARPTLAAVVAVGPEVVGLAPGEEIIYVKYAGAEFELDGATYLILKAEDVLATLEGHDAKN